MTCLAGRAAVLEADLQAWSRQSRVRGPYGSACGSVITASGGNGAQTPRPPGLLPSVPRGLSAVLAQGAFLEGRGPGLFMCSYSGNILCPRLWLKVAESRAFPFKRHA